MLYLYRNPDNPSEVEEVIQGMNDKHVFEKDGKKWDRIFTPFQIADSTPVDPFNSRQFVEKTSGKGTVGDVLDRAEELSKMREDKLGHDPIKKKYEENYSKKRGGAKAPKSIKDLVVNI